MTAFLDDYAAERSTLVRAADELAHAWRTYQHVTDRSSDAGEGLVSLDLEAVRRALGQHQLSIGVFGLIKRGKSTLVNALVGREVSGAHVTPETAVPVYVEYAEEPTAEVRFVDGRTEIVATEDALAFTSQKHNEGNHRGVLFVRQHVPSPLLANGVRLIDTPGLDDAEADETYTERTLEEVRRVDAAVVTLLSPPTIGATEARFLQHLAAHGPDHLVFVINMYPQHYHDPVTHTEIVSYVRDQIGTRVAGDLTVVPVCAQDGWEGRQRGDFDLWERSGVAGLQRHLEGQLANRARRQLLGEASEALVRSGEAMIAQARRRRALLTQPSALAEHRASVNEAAEQVVAQLRTAVAIAIADADRRQRRLRIAVEQSFADARANLRKAESPEELQRELRRIRRSVELRCSVAGRGLAESLQQAIGELQEALARAVVSTDQLLRVPEEVAVTASEGALSDLTVGDQLGRIDAGFLRSIGSAAAGGALVGGVGAMAVGALLGPIGLLGGALAGWRLGAHGGSGALDRLRQTADERVELLAEDVLRAFDASASSAVEQLRIAAHRRVDAYARELLSPLIDVERLASDPEAVEHERRACASLFVSVATATQAAEEARGPLVDVASVDELEPATG